jgi:hypothetical protein
VKIKKVALEPTAVLQVKLPPDHVPMIVHDPERGVVEIAPAKPSWWKAFFGPAT